MECFGDTYVVETAGARLAVLELREPLELLDLRGTGAMKAGSIAAVSQDGARETTQDWGRYWYEHPDFGDLDGLLYPGAHDHRDAVAVWERADGNFEVKLDLPLDHPDVVPELLVIADELDMPMIF